MQIPKNKSTTKLKTSIVILIVSGLLVAGYTVAANMYGLWPMNNNNVAIPSNEGSTSRESEDKDQVNSEDTDDSSIDDPVATPVPADDNDSYVESPISQPPESDDPYPIENEHYKIAQKSKHTYHITLYPIANNPQYSDYNAQLKAYKNEALDYLKKRYGSIANFNITWTPENAENT